MKILERNMAKAKAFGIAAELITPDQVRVFTSHPALTTDQINVTAWLI